MRWQAATALTALAALLSGCAVPTDEEAADPLFGLCPQWSQGPGGLTMDFQVAGNESRDVELAGANATDGGHALDLYRVRLDKLEVQGRLELRAFAADGHQLAIRDYRQPTAQLVPVVVFTDGSAVAHEFDVFLSTVGHNDPGSPAPATLRWTPLEGSASVGASVTFHYKVCGAEV